MSINVSTRNTGINFNNKGEATITVWAPLANKITVVLEGEGAPKSIALSKEEYGYWRSTTNDIGPGAKYKIAVDDNDPLPDPASLAQPDGVHGASMAIDLKDFNWRDNSWKNIPLPSYIIYELHTGTFTPEQNFDGIINKLDYLVSLGINAIEIMPVGQFPGSRNWGYDGVYPFAVQNSYGGAKKLQELVDACHQKGIAVILDVIYNHLGPEGNYLGSFGPYFTEKYKTPWGQALNFDDAWCDGVRDYFIDNALMWFRDFHIDALRMDAVHAIKDFGPVHLMKAIRQKTNELSAATGKPYYLIAEMDLNDPIFINSLEQGGYGADAQWIDEFHHALRVSSGQEREGYYSDFDGIEHLAKSYNDAYVYDGQFSEHRKKFFGSKTNNAGHQFVVFSQNHDHTGNRMLGERTSQLVSFEMCKVMAAAVLIAPYLPMLFMGEEYAESNPFQFFISHTDKELAALVNKGRKEEFSSFNWQGEAPDPRLEETFNHSRLQWNLIEEDAHRKMLAFYKKLIELRKAIPALAVPDRNGTSAEADASKKLLILRRKNNEQEVVCVMNFSQQSQSFEINNLNNFKLLLDSSASEWNGPTKNPPDANNKTVSAESVLIYISN